MSLVFTDHEDVVFQEAPLTLVLSQIRFPPVLSLMTNAGITGFQDVIRPSFPTMLPTTREATIQLTPDAVQTQTAAPVWKFASSSGSWTVSLAADFLAIETTNYTDINDFLSRYLFVVNALHKTVRPADSTRVGFRKINVFEQEGRNTAAFSNMIRAELLGPLSVAEYPAMIGGFASQLGFVDEDNTLMVRYGITGADDEPMKYTLDMDFYTERPTAVENDTALQELLRYFSDSITSFFHWATVDEYKESITPHQRHEAVDR